MASEDPKREDPKTNARDKSGLIAGGGALSGLAALIGTSCCVLPLVLINLGASTALVSKLSFFVRAQPYFLGAGVILVAAAVIAAFWNGRRPSRLFVIVLVLAVLFVIGAAIMPFYEGRLLRWINAS